MKKSVVNFRWEEIRDYTLPKTKQFHCTGYSDNEDVLFSIVVRLVDFDGNPENATEAEIFALSEDMEEYLPREGVTFYFTAGTKIVAKGVAKYRNF